ncbi:cutinase transcription factor 1 beta [Trichoderma asperellum]|uniref:Cutinase transcription factor 1 beta n=1 Tax=Trichoderma asperellum TaxID=101201 RepID=A0A6V8R4C7_TRIAP|nr:cutinase transcription factor 1 beta [Trichoderma asperellum]
MPRRRASKACLHCRQRKVRCDVTLRGVPCLNCQLDHQTCAIQERKSKRPLADSKISAYREGGAVIEGLSTRVADENPSGIDSIDQWAKRLGGVPPFGAKGLSTSPHSDARSNESNCIDLEGFSPKTASAIANVHNGKTKSSRYSTFSNSPKARANSNAYNSYDTLPFVATPELGHLSALDVRFMQLNGCFELPPMPILNELFIPEAVAEAAGFPYPRAAAEAFYKKTKILYDFEIESNPIALGQVAILLTFWPGGLRLGLTKANSAWLGTAIRHAKSLRAHHLSSKHASQHTQNVPPKTRILLRRLWWCCYFRDRSLALALRRTMRIPEKYPLLTLEDFEGEFHRSRVYNAEAKRHIFDIYIQISKLVVIMTDVLRLCSISEDGIDSETTRTDHHAIANCMAQLQAWHDETRLQFPDDGDRPGIQPHFVIIQTNLMFIYYFAAKLAIHHQEIFYAVRDSDNANGEGPYPSLAGTSDQVRDAVNNLIKHLSNPVQLGLAQYLPVSVVAFVAMPLLVQILNAKIMSRGVVSSRAAMHQEQLHSLINLVKQCHRRLGGVDAMCVIIRRLTDAAQSRFLTGKASQVTEFIELIDYSPLEYLRFFLNLDLNLSNATLVENIRFSELKEELLQSKKTPSESERHTPAPDAEQTPSSTQPTEPALISTSTQQDAWGLNFPGAKADPFAVIGDSPLDFDELLSGQGMLGIDPSLIDLESLPFMNQRMEWEMDAWLVGGS